MAIYTIAEYRVKRKAAGKVKKAIKEFVRYIKAKEPGTQMYLAWQNKKDPTRFVHFFIFKDRAANARHGRSKEVKRFEAVYGPQLLGGHVVFTDYNLVAMKK